MFWLKSSLLQSKGESLTPTIRGLSKRCPMGRYCLKLNDETEEYSDLAV